MGSAPTIEENMLSRIPTSNQCVLRHPRMPSLWFVGSSVPPTVPVAFNAQDTTIFILPWEAVVRLLASKLEGMCCKQQPRCAVPQ